MKKKSVIAIAGMMSLWLAACGQAGGGQNVQTEPSVVETVQETRNSEETPVAEETQAAQTEAPAESTAPAEIETPVQTEAPAQAATDAAETEAAAGSEAASSSTEETQASGGYADNFAVDSEAAAAFGTRIKDAVAAQDIEALADLASFPLYVGFTDESVNVTSREEFVALGAERIFTPELVDSVGNADVNGLSPSMAGFALSSNDGPNIIFSVVNGALAIQGINY